MRRSPFARAFAVAILTTASAAANPSIGEPPRRQLELGAFVGVDYFGDDIELGNSWAPEQVPGTSALVGARLTWIALPDVSRRGTAGARLDLGLELETKFAAASTADSADGERGSYFAPVFGYRAHVFGRIAGLSRIVAPHVVIGGGGETITSSSPFMADDTDAIVYYGIGSAFLIGRRWAIRLDLRHGLTPGRTDPVTSVFEAQLGAGARFDIAGGGPSSPTHEDRDRDGIADASDRCPGEAETKNGFEDTDGCPDTLDQDHDGLADDVDKCPWDAEDKNQIDDTDGCPDADDDHDGVVGSRDACPTAAEDRDRFKDDDGCPDPDNDGDNVADAQDACPLEPETFNGVTDDDGCPDKVPEELAKLAGPVDGIKFLGKTARLALPGSQKALDKLFAILRKYPALKIRLEGHTEGGGDRMDSVDLSKRRAEAVKWSLVDRGITPDRIVTEGLGPDRPPAGKPARARIEVHLLAATPPSPPAK